MKRIYLLLGILLITIVISILLLISNFWSIKSPKSQESVQAGFSFKKASLEQFLRFVESDPVLKNDGDLKYLNVVDIEKKYDNDGNALFFAKTTPDFIWFNELYMITIGGNGEITQVVNTGLSGNSSYFSYDVVHLSQGDFIAAYCSSHMGNGGLDLVAISEPGTIKYSLDGVDHHYEDMMLTATEYGVGKSASAIYLGGKLHADYEDVNNDGFTDVTLTGIEQIFTRDADLDEQILKKEFYIRKVYIYDPIKDNFVFDDLMSEKALVNSY